MLAGWGGGWGRGVPFKAKRNKNRWKRRGGELITVSQSRQERREQRFPRRCGIKGMKVPFKGKRGRAPSLAQIRSSFGSIGPAQRAESGQRRVKLGPNPWTVEAFHPFLLDLFASSV